MNHTARTILEIINTLGILITIYLNFLKKTDKEKLIMVKSHWRIIEGLVFIILGLGFFIFTIITINSSQISRAIGFTFVGIILVMGGSIMIKHRKKDAKEEVNHTE
jgi:uncharacterized membrane protein HdeD (DUF308 family)